MQLSHTLWRTETLWQKGIMQNDARISASEGANGRFGRLDDLYLILSTYFQIHFLLLAVGGLSETGGKA